MRFHSGELIRTLCAFALVFAALPPHARTQTPSPSANASSSLSLLQTFGAALEKTESVRIQEARVQQSEERLRQAKGGIIPHFAFNANYLKQDVPESLADSSGFAGFTRSQQSSTRLTATQPLFQGFREFSAIRALGANVDAQRQSKEFSRVALYGDVARAFFNVLAAEKDLENLNALIDITERRITNLKAFARLGRSPRTDLLTSQSQLASLRAEAAAALGTRDRAREQFALVTGLPAETRLQDGEGVESLPKTIEPVDSYLSQLEERPDVKGFIAQTRSAEANVRVAKGAYWPTIQFTGNYYFSRTGSLQGTKWDLGVVLSMPIYEGGILVSQVREASSVFTETQLNLEQARRTAREEIATAHKAVVSGIDQMRLLVDSVDLAEKTYRQQNRDYSYGATTNLDVLQALNSLATARRLRDRTYYQTRAAMELLLVAQGKAPQP